MGFGPVSVRLGPFDRQEEVLFCVSNSYVGIPLGVIMKNSSKQNVVHRREFVKLTGLGLVTVVVGTGCGGAGVVPALGSSARVLSIIRSGNKLVVTITRLIKKVVRFLVRYDGRFELDVFLHDDQKATPQGEFTSEQLKDLKNGMTLVIKSEDKEFEVKPEFKD